MLGLSKRWGVGKKFKEVLNFESYVPPEGYVDPPEPIATEPYHERPVWVTNPGENPLDVEYMCGLARKHFSAEKAAFAVQSFRKGFLDSYTGPPYTQALTSNRIEPGDPGTAEVGEQLLRIAEEGQLYCSRLPVAGTRILPMDILSKIRPDGKEKLRVTCNGKYPGGDMIQHSRKAWTPRTHVSYSQDSGTLQMARYLYHPPRCAIVSDLKNAFEKLKKHPTRDCGQLPEVGPGSGDVDEAHGACGMDRVRTEGARRSHLLVQRSPPFRAVRHPSGCQPIVRPSGTGAVRRSPGLSTRTPRSREEQMTP